MKWSSPFDYQPKFCASTTLSPRAKQKHERAERAKEEDFDAEERELLNEENEQEEELFDQVC